MGDRDVPMGSAPAFAGAQGLTPVAGDGTRPAKQLLHLVFGGELKALDKVEFADVAALDIIGVYPNYAEAYKAWKAAAQKTVDNAQMRYFIVHMHRLLDPELTGPPPGS
jgi:hypothetical protein